MSTMQKVIAGGVAGLALMLSAGAALAYPGEVNVAANVRSGPGVNYPVVGTLAPGEGVNVGQCQYSWCYVTDPTADGWVAAGLLADLGVPTPIYAPSYFEPENPPIVSPSISIGPNFHHFPHQFHHWQGNGGNFGRPPHVAMWSGNSSTSHWSGMSHLSRGMGHPWLDDKRHHG